MNITEKSTFQLEILISTMNRTSLDFLDGMFKHNDLSQYQLLIINQTTQEHLLVSNIPNIKVLNSFEMGLPLSRNLAIENCSKDICLFADDDVIYKNDFEKDILNAYKKYSKADIITFQMLDNNGDLYRNYPNIVHHDKKTIATANSVVISFNRTQLIEKKIVFNINFGLGALFQTADEYVFLRNALKKNGNLYFEPEVILSHPNVSSGRDGGSDRIVFARAALFYKYSGFLGYLRLVKYLYLNYRYKEIKFNQLLPKFAVGIDGIRNYKRLMKKGLEER